MSLSLIELLAHLNDEGARVRVISDEDVRITFERINPLKVRRLMPIIRTYRHEIRALFNVTVADPDWPFPGYEEGMCSHEVNKLISRIVAETTAHAARLSADIWWRVNTLQNETYNVEVLRCADGCVANAIDDEWREKFFNSCGGARLRLYSVYGWITRPEEWLRYVEPLQ